MAVAGLKDTVTDLFSGNPFATEVGHRIEQATDPKLGSENWALFMEICDLINENEESAKDAARAIKKRLQNVIQAKDFDAAQLVLTVLETCVKNCGKRFHAIVCSKDYASELVKLIGVRYEPPVILQERVLGLIQNWAETFRASPDLHGVTEVYDDLKAKGVEFPVLDLDAMAPIITPQRTVAAPSQPPTSARRSSGPAQQAQQPQPVVQEQHQPASAAASFPTGPLVLNPEQLAKLRGDVDVVRGNMQVFTDMLTEMKPGQEDPDDLQLLVDLQTTIRSMQDRVVQLLGGISNEEVTGELLAINDEMNALFLRYERYERQRKGAATIQTRALPQVPQTSQMPMSMPEPSTLIDFSESQAANRNLMDSTRRQMENMSLGQKGATGGLAQSPRQAEQHDSDNEDFGVFALSRVGSTQPPPAIPHSGSASEMPKADELAEMEKWLKSQPESNLAPHPDRPSLTSSEFDKFLESRAVAADTLPTIPASLGSDQSAQPVKPSSHLMDS